MSFSNVPGSTLMATTLFIDLVALATMQDLPTPFGPETTM
jgi:hypothetical protein